MKLFYFPNIGHGSSWAMIIYSSNVGHATKHGALYTISLIYIRKIELENINKILLGEMV